MKEKMKQTKPKFFDTISLAVFVGFFVVDMPSCEFWTFGELLK